MSLTLEDLRGINIDRLPPIEAVKLSHLMEQQLIEIYQSKKATLPLADAIKEKRFSWSILKRLLEQELLASQK